MKRESSSSWIQSPSILDNASKIIAFFDSHDLGSMYYPNGAPGNRPTNGVVQRCMLGLWATILPPSDKRNALLQQLWDDTGSEWYGAQYCLLGKVIAAGLFHL